MSERATEWATAEWVEYQGPECVDLDLVRWDGDSATVTLTDGSELLVDVRQLDRSEFRVELEALLEPGIELHTFRTAEPWLRAHEGELMARYDEHCLNERWADG